MLATLPKNKISELIANAIYQSYVAHSKLNEEFSKLGIEIQFDAYSNDEENYIKVVTIFKFKDKDLYDMTKKLLAGIR